MLDPIQAIILGAFQGITEFLPISSSGHLILVRWLFGWQDPGLTFDVALHVGTLVAVIAYFWSDWIRIIGSGVESIVRRRVDNPSARLAWLIVFATVPGALIGALAEEFVDAFFHGDDATGAVSTTAIAVVAIVLMLVGVVLYVADRLNRRKDAAHDMGLVQGVLIGLAQAFAVIPGVSRSGATITAGLLLGLSRTEAARFSFLLSAPIILGAGLKSALTVAEQGVLAAEIPSYAAGMITAAIVGYAAIAFMLRFLQRNSVAPFMVYRLALGAVILVLIAVRGG